MYQSKEGKKLYRYYRCYEEDFFLFLGKTMAGSNEEDIHGLRVTIKKLRTVIKFLALLSEDFSSGKNFAQLKTIFKPAGSLRECQVNIKRLKDFEGYDLFYSAFKKARKSCMKKHRHSFDHALYAFKADEFKLTGKTIKQNCKSLSKEVIYSKAKAFIENRIERIYTLHALSDEDIENVHQIRIKLKEISAVLGLLHTMRPKKITSEKLADLKLQEDEIGRWHDYAVLQDSIDVFSKSVSDQPDLEQQIIKVKAEISAKEHSFLTNLEGFVYKTVMKIDHLLIPVSGTIEKLAQTSQPSE